MGKDRKLKKGRQEEDFGEEEVENDNLNSEESSTTAGIKKRKSKKKDDSDKTTDLAQKIESLSLEDLSNQRSKPSNRKEGKKNKTRAEKNKGDDSEDEAIDNKIEKQTKKGDKKKTVDDDNDNIMDDNIKSNKKKGKKSKDESDDDEISTKQSKGRKNKKKDVVSDDEYENRDRREEKFNSKKQKENKSKLEQSDEEDESIVVKDNKLNKKSRKGKSDSIDDDDLIETAKASRKQKGKKVIDEISGDDSESVSNVVRTKKKDDHSKKLKESKEEIDDESIVPKKKSMKPKSVFELLDVEDDDMDLDDDDDDDDDSNKAKSKPEMKKQSSEEQDSSAVGKGKDEKGKKSKKKERRKKHDEDEEVEKMLEELALEIEGKKPAAEKQKESTPENIEQDIKMEEPEKVSKKKKKKKNEVEITETQIEETEGVADAEKEEHTVKTAAQKKKEKKEKEKQKKLSQKTQATVKNEAEIEVSATTVKPTVTEIDAEAAMAAEEEKEEADDDDSKQKKKKKKKGEEEKKDKKRPGKKQILAMQEALKKLKEEEERIKLEEEAKQRAAEEAERKRQEQLRLEQERKERKKQKEKEKRERLKAEGKILTKSQKQSRARMEATLTALRMQGIEVPQIGEKRERAPRLGDKKKSLKKKPAEAQPEQKEVTTPEETSLPEVEVEIVSQTENKIKEESIPEEKIKESWEDKDDVKDAWDETSEEEEDDDDEGEKETQPQAKDKISQEIVVKKEESEESDEEDDDDDGERDDEDEDETSEESDDDRNKQEKIKERVQERIQRRREEAEKKRTTDKLRSPVVCVLGHVDTGKTKILDKIRRTHVQDNEAGGITQQIGATMVPQEALKEQCKMVKNFPEEIKLPGLLIIDTPGHESFSNLRSRGSSLCDIAILVVDIMHGLEPQTLESINLLKQKKTPFVVALNKIDRLYDWKSSRNKDIQDIIKSQARNTKLEFDERVREIVVQFAEQSLNAALSYENKDPRTYISMVPTSAFTGEGMGNLMALIVELSQTMMAKRLAFSEELQATVLEVKAIPGLGTTIDVILVNGRLREGDIIVVAGQEGPVVTQIRSLLMPEPLKELRVKNPYNDFREVEGAQGVKIAGKDLEKAIAGLQLLVAYHPDEVELLKEEVANSLRDAINSIKLAERGVYVQASTLGSLEALLEFLRTSKIPYSGVRIGPVVKKDVMKASIMLEHETQYAVILAFDVKVERDAEELAENLGVRIFQANIIYHLFDRFTAYQDELHQKKRDEYKHIAVFPCKLRILPQYIFNSRDPIVIGVSVEAGVVREGTPICVPSREFLDIGTVTTLELNHKSIDSARKGQEICIKIEPHSGEAPKMYGRHFDETDILVSKITRQSIDACKNYFRDDLQKPDWQLMVELKKMFQIL
ncbi:eukaryotic translation initiation factor 5B isoform X2 [Centruroides vittatus]|uniref:eukaryotic translation initiation factor 5B isoform X2 n=1 Tax=Centruroides vittatus TaxID=120091 RepID=UPI00350FECB6